MERMRARAVVTVAASAAAVAAAVATVIAVVAVAIAVRRTSKRRAEASVRNRKSIHETRLRLLPIGKSQVVSVAAWKTRI